VVLVAAGVFVLLENVVPRWVRGQIVEQARARGVTLEIADFELGLTQWRLSGVRITAARLPGCRVSAAEVDLALHWFHPAQAIAHHVQIELNGPVQGVADAVAAWLPDARNASAPSAWWPASLVSEDAQLVWQGPLRPDVRADIAALTINATWPPEGDLLRCSSSTVTLAVPGGKLGPWRLDAERTSSLARLRVALDPRAPDSRSLFAYRDAANVSFKVDIPRSPLSRLGIPSHLLGLGSKDPEIALALRYDRPSPQRSTLASEGQIYSLEPGWLPGAIDLGWKAVASGDPQTGMALDGSELAVGPLKGPVRGTLQVLDDGLRLDAGWRGNPVRCAELGAALDPSANGLGSAVRAWLAEASGVARVMGTVGARATFALDTRDPNSGRLAFIPQITCAFAMKP
jgi:hypothetical protein